MSTPTFEITREEFQQIYDQFRDLKHGINNTLAVIMALSELSQRNPTHFEKLAKTVLTRSPEVVQLMQDFHSVLAKKLRESEVTLPGEKSALED